MNYQKRIDKVITYIGHHLNENFTLDQLSEIACFSRFHFHRLFTAYTGLSFKQYVRWLRLKRAAHQLIVEKDKKIIEIAMDAGFESHEAFSRVFKKTCGMSPNQFRQDNNWAYWDQSPYQLPQIEDIKMINVEIREINEKRLAIVEHRGSVDKLGESINKLINWSQAQTINLKPKPGEAFGFAYDDPKTTKPEDFRYDIGITVPENLAVKSDDVIERRLPKGRYAIAMHKGSRDNIGETVYGLYRDWLPQSGEALGDLPCLFCYYNFDHEVAETELLTECWLLLD